MREPQGRATRESSDGLHQWKCIRLLTGIAGVRLLPTIVTQNTEFFQRVLVPWWDSNQSHSGTAVLALSVLEFPVVADTGCFCV